MIAVIDPVGKTFRQRSRAELPARPAGTVFVLRDLDGRIIERPKGWHKFDATEVDIRRHRQTVDLIGELPSRDGFFFDARADVEFWVHDPAEIIRRSGRDLVPIVVNNLPKILGPLSRNFETYEARALKQRGMRELAGGVALPEGITVFARGLNLESELDRRHRLAREAEARPAFNNLSLPTRPTYASRATGDCKIFLCHSSGDKERVRKLYRHLLEDGFACWLDEESLLPGQD